MCEVCGKVFDGKHKLYQHRLTHTEIQTPKHKCPHCDKVYLLKTRLKIHMSKHIGNSVKHNLMAPVSLRSVMILLCYVAQHFVLLSEYNQKDEY